MNYQKTIFINGPKITLTLRKSLFWDINIQSMDIVTHQRLIIERVFTRGNLSEYIQVIKHFEKDIIIENLKKIGTIDDKTLNFICKTYKVPKTEFKCYTKKQSVTTHWD